jgi:putative membrane protein
MCLPSVQSLAMLWLKAFHIVFMVNWFAGLFYLPRLFIYHLATTDAPGRARFIVMERRLFAIMSIGALLTVLLGTTMIMLAPALLATPWMHLKLPLVAVLIGYHAWVYRLMSALRTGTASHSQRWYRWFNEIPGVLLIAIVLLAVLKP